MKEPAISRLLISKNEENRLAKRRNHDAAFKARVALEAVKAARPGSELAAEQGVHPTMTHQWKRSLLEGAAGIFERGGKAAAAAGIARR